MGSDIVYFTVVVTLGIGVCIYAVVSSCRGQRRQQERLESELAETLPALRVLCRQCEWSPRDQQDDLFRSSRAWARTGIQQGLNMWCSTEIYRASLVVYRSGPAYDEALMDACRVVSAEMQGVAANE